MTNHREPVLAKARLPGGNKVGFGSWFSPTRLMRASNVCFGLALLIATPAMAQTEATAVTRSAVVPVVRRDVTAGIAAVKINRMAVDRAALTIALEQNAGANLKLLDAQGKEVPTRRSAAGELQADVDPRRGYILTPATSARKPMTKEGIEMPARYVTFAPNGATNLGGLFLRPAVVPLTWNDSQRAYATELFVGYEFQDGAERPLAAPKTVTFFAEAANARIQADRVVIERSGGSGYKRVVLSTGKLDGETHFTARVGPGDELKSSVTVQREAGALSLSLPSTELAGYGVGSAQLTIAVLGRDGLPFAVPAPLEVQLTGRQVRPPTIVTIPEGGSSVSVDVRSTGLGAGEIVAQSGPLRAALPVQLVFPLAAVVAAIVGGVLGGAARYLRNRGRKGALLLRRLIEGALVGLLIVGAAWAGLVIVDTSTGVLGTPFGAFVLAALSGYLGCVVLDRVAKKTFGGGKE